MVYTLGENNESGFIHGKADNYLGQTAATLNQKYPYNITTLR